MTGMQLRGNHIYDHLGIRSKRIDEQSAETLMPINDDVRVGDGLRAAPLGLAFEQGVATYLFDHVMAVPSQISLHIRDRGAGVIGIRSVTSLVRLGRSLVTVVGEIRDEADSSRLLAYGSIAWSVIGPAPARDAISDRSEWPLPAAGVDIVSVAGITPLADGTGCRLDGLTPQTTGPGGILHAGMLQLLCEQAALVAAGRATGTSSLVAVDCAYNFLQPGRIGPFVAVADVLYSGEEGIDTKVLVTDAGNADRVLTVSFVRVRA